jgi:hypothetical protein
MFSRVIEDLILEAAMMHEALISPGVRKDFQFPRRAIARVNDAKSIY